MTEDQEDHERSAEVDELAEWILFNLDKEGVTSGLAVCALGCAIAVTTAGQPRNQAELLETVIGAIRNTFNDAMAAQAEVFGERIATGATLQ